MNRIASIDILRGLVMIIMALDHTRDLFHIGALTTDPTDLTTTTPALFFTRWITHLCAPVFVFLSGMSIFLKAEKTTNGEMSRYLLTRGLLLILLEMTVVTFGIWMDIHFRTFLFQVIFAIGIGFVAFAGIIWLPRAVIGIIGLIIVAGHGLLANVDIPGHTPTGIVWTFLFRPGFPSQDPNFFVMVMYPVIPWLGIMMAGYGAGSLIFAKGKQRLHLFAWIGAGALVLFFLLRVFNIYGDPEDWSVQKNGVFTFLSLMNVNKYPPSLLFTLVTLGIGCLLVFVFSKMNNRLTGILTVYGRESLFYYLVHWYLLHLILFALIFMYGHTTSEMSFAGFDGGRPTGFGFHLPGVYLIWGSAVVLMYPFCRWWTAFKKRKQWRWTKFL